MIKVDIKPFVIRGLPSHIKPTDILIESVSDQHARVRQLNEVKDAVHAIEGAHFKSFSSIVDYHSHMFEFGVVPKNCVIAATDQSFIASLKRLCTAVFPARLPVHYAITYCHKMVG